MLCSAQTSISFGNYVLIDQVWVVWHAKVEGDWKKKNEKRLTYCCQSFYCTRIFNSQKKCVHFVCVHPPPPNTSTSCVCERGRAAQLVAQHSTDVQYRCTVQMYSTDVGLISQCNKGYCPSHLSVQTLLWCSHSRCVQLHTSTFVFRLKSQALADMLVFGHAKRMHTPVGMVSSALVAAGASPR